VSDIDIDLSPVAAPDGLLTGVLESVGLADVYAEWDTPLGHAFVAWNPRGISYLDVIDDPAGFEAGFAARIGRRLRATSDRPPAPLQAALERRLSGGRGPTRADLRTLTAFERSVLEVTTAIPAGEARPYSWVAREIGRPKAVRAVGTALARNPVPLLIPCHRVVRNDGIIGNYGLGGPVNKRLMLTMEGVPMDQLEPARGLRGSDTTHIFCLPWCSYGRRVMPVHQRSFRSAAEAKAAGYRACKHCRPVE
jgi:O-6-methylguanine DNA methyltransferase